MISEEVRVRFAPSPTGYVHVGSLRTALFNYLFAKKHNGKLIIRIEDTDRTRFVEGSIENLVKVLSDLGIDYDEGPMWGGDYGPYFQSERLDIYKKYCDELVEKGFAYYAFETPEELDEMRKMQQLEGRQTAYDRRARNLTPEEVRKNLKEGKPYVIRLKVPLNEEVKFDDIIKGTIKFETNQVDDQVLLKSDGFPTYHLANVVDDHLMEITHIIRGEEWITSVPKHILLYNAFGWEIPKMAHVPLLLNPDKSKLSKRQGDVAVEDYLRKGYLKEAFLNFIALLGWHPAHSNIEGEKHEKKDDKESKANEEIMSMEELIKNFSLERVQIAGAVFDLNKLNWMNNEYIKSYDLDNLLEISMPYFAGTELDLNDKEKLKFILSTIRVYLEKLSDIPGQTRVLEKDNITIPSEFKEIVYNENSKKVFEALIAKLQGINEITPDWFKNTLNEVGKETEVKGKNLFKPVRIALTGEEHGPELPNIATIYGKDKLIQFLQSASNPS
ncbi:MAG TPA: glutamate--tRNA ligase [Ignavibacteria bacterium]|nr:glutamate--tRNA ligase [Ignavibacteria bacterium]